MEIATKDLVVETTYLKERDNKKFINNFRESVVETTYLKERDNSVLCFK